MLVYLRLQVAKIQAATGDNLFDKLANNRSISRVILKHSVPLMVSRLGPRFPAASLRGLLFPIVQTVVVEHQIAKISSHEEYAELRTARLKPRRGVCLTAEDARDAAKEPVKLSQGYVGHDI